MNSETPTPTVADRKVRLKRKGYPAIERENRLGSKFTTRIRYRGKVHFLTLTEHADSSFSAALEARRRIQSGHWEALKAAVRLRAECTTTLADIEAAYLNYKPAPPKILAADTKTKNLHALKNFLRKAGIEPVAQYQIGGLNGELVYKWKQAILAECQDQTPEDATRLCRSANSILIQARSVFSDEARTYYERAAQLKLPASLDTFRKEPGFKQVAKTEYHVPTDLVIAKTFAHLNTLRTQIEVLAPNISSAVPSALPAPVPAAQNEFVACWLALGFGLRASEIARATKEDFQDVAGDIAFRPPWFGKNKKSTPEVRVQLGAWQHLGAIVASLSAGAHLLSGPETERTSDVFRRISGWMKALGWETTHHIHELRAWAGSYIADHAAGDGIRAAQIFLRHRSYATTEKAYGHHRKQQLGKVALTMPQVQPLAPAVTNTPANVVQL